MSKHFVMGPDAGPDDPSTINLHISTLLGAGSTTRYDDNGNAVPGPFDTVSTAGYAYIVTDAYNIATLVGTPGGNELDGTAGNDFITWENSQFSATTRYLLANAGITDFELGNGDDILNLTYSNPTINGQGPQPFTTSVFINGGGGSDIIWSGFGNDSIVAGSDNSNDTVYGGGGNDTISGSLGSLNAGGGSGDDTIFGGFQGSGLTGDDGNDTIFGRSNPDDINGGAGDDTLFGGGESFGGDQIDGGTGNDTIYGGNGNDNISGNVGDFDALFGDAGNDSLFDGDGVSTMSGGAGNDVLNLSIGALWTGITATLIGGDGSDLFGISSQKAGANFRIIGDGGVTDGADTISIFGMYNTAIAQLGGGDDKYTWSTSAIVGGNQIDTVFGGDGNDVIFTGNGNDFLQGDAGDDTLEGGAGADSLVGGTGIDTITYITSTVGVLMGLNGITGVGGDATGDTAANDVENLTGSNFVDSLIGNAGVNVIMGLDGNDTIEGLAGADSLFGGNGIDMVVYTNSSAAVNVTLGGSTGVGGDAQGDVISADFENLAGSAFNDTLTGSSGANFILGQGGDDTIFGGIGNDTLWGGTSGNAVIDGTNTLNGNQDNDIIVGGAGVDSIYGGTGTDSIDGGAGNDVIFGRADFLASGNTTGWDGTPGDAGIAVALGTTRYQTSDSINGNTGIDTLNLDDNVNNPGTLGAYYAAYTGGVLMLSGIEIIAATALADVINLTNGSNAAYSQNVSIFAGDGSDVVFSGSGNDVLVGDTSALGSNGGADTLFGGAGSDTIFGDLQDITGTSTFGAGDTLFGGLGNDTVFGGGGGDRIIDADGTSGIMTTSIQGGDGADFITVAFTNTQHIGLIDGGANSGADGADRILITGSYDHVTSNLGLGNDVYIGGGFEASPGVGGIDVVNGDDGNDVIAGWLGNDTLYGGSGADALWGGAGTDTIFGGDGNDYIYPGDASGGGGNIMYGGLGDDGYWIERISGSGNQIWDSARTGGTADASGNYIVIQPEFNFADTAMPWQSAPDYLANGEGVFEADHDIMNNSGMVQVVNQGGDLWTLSILNGVGAGSTNVTFDDRDITQIVLWNNDANPALNQHVLQIYTYNSGTQHWDFTS